MRIAAWAAPLVLILGLSACGGDDGGDEGSKGEDSGDSPSASSTPEPSPTESEATLEQYASIVARYAPTDELASAESCNWIGSGPLNPPGTISCGFEVLSLQFLSGNLADRLSTCI